MPIVPDRQRLACVRAGLRPLALVVALASAIAATDTPPTIGPIPGQATGADVVLVVPFTVADAQTAPGSLTATGGSSNQALVPASGLSFGGSGTLRTVTLRPAPGRTGTTTITIAVSDGALTTVTSFPLTVSPTLASGVHFPGGRIAISHDGNSYDIDDIGACAMDTALVGTAGLGGRLVHFDYDDNLALNDPSRTPQMRESALGGASRFGLDAARFFDDQTQLAGAIANFKAEAEKSTAADPLWFICAGPMEVPWRCVNAVDPAKRAFIRCISHSGWNDGFVGTQSTHDWQALTALGVVAYHVIDQNGSNGDYDWQTPESYWYWLRDAADPNLRWLYSRDSAHFDVSDSGMTYWLISGGPNGGNQRAGWPEAKALLVASTPTPRGPFGGAARSVTTVIQAEDYDLGGEGVAYHDDGAGNAGGAYRTDGVDLEPCADAGGGVDVGWIVAGEWLDYTVTVPAAGGYTASLRTASATAGGSIALSIDGQALASVPVAGTGGWQAWRSATSGVIDLPAGTHVLRLAFAGGSGYICNVNSFVFTAVTTPTGPAATGFTLIDARSDRPVPGFDPIPAGATIDTDALGTTALTLRANTVGAVGSVRFGLDATTSYRVENVAPWAFAGDASGDYAAWSLAPGTHRVTATPFSGAGATGTAGTAATATFTLVTAPTGAG